MTTPGRKGKKNKKSLIQMQRELKPKAPKAEKIKPPALMIPASPDKPIMPRGMSPIAQEQWPFVTSLIEELGMLSKTDTLAIQLLCEAYGDYMDAVAQIERSGGAYYKTKTSRGKGIIWRSNPALRQKDDADKRVRSWLDAFGMTPRGRKRIAVSEDPTPGQPANDDPTVDYFNAA